MPGVPWQPLRYERQLQYKHELVEDALRRIGGFDEFDMEPIVPAVNPWRYRNKMEYTYGGVYRRAFPSDSTRGVGGTVSTTRATAGSHRSAATPCATRCATGAPPRG